MSTWRSSGPGVTGVGLNTRIRPQDDSSMLRIGIAANCHLAHPSGIRNCADRVQMNVRRVQWPSEEDQAKAPFQALSITPIIYIMSSRSDLVAEYGWLEAPPWNAF
jgi:hypothetical protein